MTLSSGSRFGQYEVLSSLGAGGMGEVYRARDPKLHRDVALKVLPSEVANDAERLARFRREAQLLAGLNHPNIAHVYGLEESDGATALVMELVHGEDLARRLARGPVPIAEALSIARQIAAALESAHDAGIVHRDLKPANIKLSDDGAVKVLDFGLAKAILGPGGAGGAGRAGGTSEDFETSPTITTPAMTQAGMILGTAAYMAPEQAKGRPVDKRADVWAFGCVLYEMFTGARAFEGDDVSDTMAAILRSEPDWTKLPAGVPESVRQLVRGCLEKDRRARVPDIGVARYLLDERFSSSAIAAPDPALRRSQTQRVALLASAAFVVGVLLTLSFFKLRPAPLPTSAVPAGRFAATLDQPAFVQRDGGNIAIAADGSFFVYVAGPVATGTFLVKRQLDQLTGVQLEGTSGARYPFISIDNKWIGFFAGGEVRKVPVAGGTAVTLCSYNGNARGGAWIDDGTIVFGTSLASGILRVSESGGNPTPITNAIDQPNRPQHIFPSLVSGTRSVLFTSVPPGGPASIVAVNLDSRAESIVATNVRALRTSLATGYLVSDRASQLEAVAFDARTLAIGGDPMPIATGVFQAAQGFADFAVSANGVLVYFPVGATSEVATTSRSLVWVDRRGVETPVGAPTRSYEVARVSPDGTKIAVDTHDEENDIWIWDTIRNTLSRLTQGPPDDQAPIWSRDGEHVLYTSNRSGIPNVFRQRADGAGSVERLTESGQTQFLTSVSPDGTDLLMFRIMTNLDIAVARLASAKTPITAFDVLIPGDGRQRFDGELSPDGRWMALHSNDTGRYEVYVRPYPKIDEGRWQISTRGGSRPAWSRDGKELFYLDDSGLLTSVTVKVDGTKFSAGLPVQILKTAYVAGSTVRGLDLRSYDVSPDGQRFLMVKAVAGRATGASSPSLVVATNWMSELRAAATR